MDKVLVSRFMEAKPDIATTFSQAHPSSYEDVVRAVVSAIQGEEYGIGPCLDPNRIHSIDDGNYQGMLVFVIAEKGYQPSDYWYVKVDYGSCSGCDTLESIRQYEDGQPTEDQVSKYMTLALHIVQGLKKMGDEV